MGQGRLPYGEEIGHKAESDSFMLTRLNVPLG
jgi:hypothetical protein